MFEEDDPEEGHDNGSVEEAAQKGALINLTEFKRSDGDIGMSKAQAGVLRTLISAIESDKDYRELLMKADFMSPNEADKAANAIAWALRYGVSIAPILDKIAARCAVKAHRVEQTLEGLTSIRWMTNKYGKKQDSGTTKGPISR